VNLFEGALCSLEPLIRAQPDDLDEISEALARSLLCSRNDIEQEKFQELRRKSMIALTVYSPTIVASWLTNQFYEKNYSLYQRMEILDILVEAAKELSSFNAEKSTPEQTEHVNWIGQVTRKGTTVRKNPSTQVIAFHSMVSSFIYPLMAHYDKKGNSFNLLEEDSFLLAKLLHSLGIFLGCAKNSLTVRKIANELFHFAMALRSHAQAVVRRGVLFVMMQIIMTFPPSMFAEDFTEHLDDLQIWLIATAHNDADDNCRMMARSIIAKTVELLESNTI